MSELNKLRNSLREHFDNSQAQYEEREWERASALLHAKRRRRKIAYVAMLLIFGISTFIITTYNWRPASEVATQASVDHDVAKSAPVNTNEDQSLKSHTRLSESTDQPSEKIKKSTTNAAMSTQDKSYEDMTAAASVSKKASETTEPSVAKKIPAVLNNSKPDDLVQREDKNPVQQENKSESNVDESKIVNAGEKITPAPAVQSGTQNDHIASQESRQDSVKTEEMKADTTRAVVAVSAAPGSESQKLDSLPRKIIGEGIFYEAGAAWFAGWKGADKRDATGFSPVVGINYLNRVSSRCAISFGIQYYMVPNLMSSSKTSRISSYKYGELSAVTVITPKTLHYLCAPLRVHLELDAKNTIGAGINMAYLINVDAKVENYDEKPGNQIENYQSMKLSGYTEGFSWYDSQVAVFYRRQLGLSFGIQAEVFAGLTDVKNNHFFGADLKERNSGLKLSLIYFAFRKNYAR